MTGGCLCEKVRYRISSPALSQGICYCRQCQKGSGMYGSPLMVLRHEAFEYSLESMSYYETKSARGAVVRRYFCSGCGTPIFSRITDIPSIVTVKVATLDDQSVFAPEYLVWTSSADHRCLFPWGIRSFAESAPPELLLRG